MKKNVLAIEICRPVGVVFEYTKNPANTLKWIPSIIEEKTSEKPVGIGTIYRQKVKAGSKTKKSALVITGFIKNKRLDFHEVNGNYSCSYEYAPSRRGTKLAYSEENGVEGKLDSPMKMENLRKLKRLIEGNI